MKAMALLNSGEALREQDLPMPEPGAGDVLIRVNACAVCRTDLHIVDGELPAINFPIIPGHEIIGDVAQLGADVAELKIGDRVGVPWLAWSCGECRFCLSGRENLCAAAEFTGYTRDGGFAEYALADHRYCFRIPAQYSDEEAAPLMCAGLIGYRAYRMTDTARRIGVYGFGAAAHVITQIAVQQEREIFAFTKPEDVKAQAFARSLGAVWAGGSHQAPPEILDAAIIFAPVGALIPAALRSVDKGGTVVCAGIHMSDIPSFPYRDLWQERAVRSVANLTRKDAEEFFALIAKTPVTTKTHTYPLAKANDALDDLRNGRFDGAAVLVMDQ